MGFCIESRSSLTHQSFHCRIDCPQNDQPDGASSTNRCNKNINTITNRLLRRDNTPFRNKMTTCNKLNDIDRLDNAPGYIFMRRSYCRWGFATCHETILAFDKAKQCDLGKHGTTVSNQERVS